jgi:hypothetical protein
MQFFDGGVTSKTSLDIIVNYFCRHCKQNTLHNVSKAPVVQYILFAVTLEIVQNHFSDVSKANLIKKAGFSLLHPYGRRDNVQLGCRPLVTTSFPCIVI